MLGNFKRQGGTLASTDLLDAGVQVTNLFSFVEGGKLRFDQQSVNEIHSGKRSKHDLMHGILWANSIYSLAALIADCIWY